ncbi:uncharacterized protein LOC113492591 [Trichoplusia ni]|uniref:Uncharacterized protein LOC113492591 n=1 Tax=Trichoplusia ni TaxID=7111 RepID=A0A7E5VC89_TRINI|nr:uncharacterized protein LOC113492591 [Trichoplusia ni]
MLRFALLLNLLLCPLVISKHKSSEDDDLGGGLVSALRNDVNLDLSMDEEYEDLRAELLAYHTALASLATGRRSMKTTPCWKLGGICIEHKMCVGHKYLTEVPGCKNNLEVCCFTWNNFQVRDMRDEGISVVAMPWTSQREVGGLGVVSPHDSEENRHGHGHGHEHGHGHGGNHDKNHHSPHSHTHAHKPPHNLQTTEVSQEDEYDNVPENGKPPVVVILRTKKK